MHPRDIIAILKKSRFNLHNEKQLQADIHKALLGHIPAQLVHREYVLDPGNIVDFFVYDIAIEVKIKAGKRAIYDQCERYSRFPVVKSLILITNTPMGFPAQLSGKDCYLFNLGTAWL